ncbi:MAG: hypothetical protein GX363_02680, partial [Clostridiales bacterium]|nr:hypothetical protein [Clostridiales bacterium]
SMKRFIEKTGRRPVLGERARFIFVPTMMGTASMVQCNCGKHLDLTDYSEW